MAKKSNKKVKNRQKFKVTETKVMKTEGFQDSQNSKGILRVSGTAQKSKTSGILENRSFRDAEKRSFSSMPETRSVSEHIGKQSFPREVKLEELQLSEEVKSRLPEIRHLEEEIEEEKRILMAREVAFLNEMLKEKKSKIKQSKKKKK